MRTITILALCLLPAAAMAQAAPGSNMPPDFYPKSPCVKPAAPGAPPESGNQAAMQAYNARVKVFNGEAVAFNACIKTYVDNAQHDVEVIQRVVHAAVEEANRH